MIEKSVVFDPITRRLARALAGDADSFHWAATEAGLDDIVNAHRLGPALAALASALAVQSPRVDTWKNQLRLSAANRMILEQSKLEIGACLGRLGIPWAPLKGMGLPVGTHPRPEERVTTDLDVLVDPHNLDAAIRALEDGGWTPSMDTPLQREFIRAEGYNWKATCRSGALLELHFRLWGAVPESMGQRVLASAMPEPSWGSSARRVRTGDAYVIAATHIWVTPRPRYLALWWDL